MHDFPTAYGTQPLLCKWKERNSFSINTLLWSCPQHSLSAIHLSLSATEWFLCNYISYVQSAWKNTSHSEDHALCCNEQIQRCVPSISWATNETSDDIRSLMINFTQPTMLTGGNVDSFSFELFFEHWTSKTTEGFENTTEHNKIQFFMIQFLSSPVHQWAL